MKRVIFVLKTKILSLISRMYKLLKIKNKIFLLTEKNKVLKTGRKVYLQKLSTL